MLKSTCITIAALSVTGCAGMEPQPAQPAQPMLTCEDCSGLTLYQEPATPAPDPRVQMAQTITSGVVRLGGIVAGTQAAVSVADTIAGAGKVTVVPGARTTTQTVQAVRPAVVEQPAPVVVQQPPAQVITQPEPIRIEPTVVEPTVVEPFFAPSN